MLLSYEYTYKDVNKTFTLKSPMSCYSFNVFYIVICSGCLEKYNGETCVSKTRVRERIREYRHHIKQPEHQQVKVDEHIRICQRDSFKMFPFLQMKSNDANLRKSYEIKFQTEYNTKLNQLWQIRVLMFYW